MITLVLGGARSGKSQVAETLAAATGSPVTYVATGSATDPDMARRIATHRERRDAAWKTVEVEPGGDLAATLASLDGTALLDSLGTWVAGAPAFAVDAGPVVAAMLGRDGDSVVVSEEVGLGVHPPSDAGRHFRDALGDLNRIVAGAAGRVLLVVAGRVVELGHLDA